MLLCNIRISAFKEIKQRSEIKVNKHDLSCRYTGKLMVCSSGVYLFACDQKVAGLSPHYKAANLQIS